ncbi:hypothetical protein PV328_001324 [Microctonus aethiopoides]|uniref:Major facilitator superfamily (MFS) profile domain-containing protein n=1 Tax=Microctonus aethiopoides TaxID=144406 RepID=A0AA39KXF8_9HYME|nr:hypothetical protein PV328_001324 [Microctonus aethiopoides]
MVKINKDLVPIKSHYFLFNAATSPIVTFLPTIAKQLGFSASLVGTIYTILPISGLIAKPLFGGLADKFRLHKVFFLAFQAIFTIAFFTIYFIPKIPHQNNANVTLTCDHAEAYLEVCSNDFTNEVLNPVIDSSITNTSCYLSCLGSSKAYQQLCHGWNMTKYCNMTNSSDVLDSKFNIITHFNMKENLPLKDCLNIHMRNASYNENSELHLPICDSLFRTTCILNCSKSPDMDELLSKVSDKTNQYETHTYQFHSFLWAATIAWVGMAVVVTIADAICIDLLGDEQGKDYGKQKMWGSVGFGIFNIGAGYLVDIFSRGQHDKDYTCIFYIMVITMIFDIIISATLKKKSSIRTETDPSVLWELGAVAREGRVLVFTFWCIGAGMCTGVVWNFLFWYAEDLVAPDEKDWIKTLQGLLTGVQCFLGELPFNFVSGWVLKKFGHINVMSLVLLIYAVRFMAYSLIRNPWLFLIVEILHGPSLGLSWPAMVAYGDKIAPSGTRATMQGFVGAVFEGLGVSFGSLICGHLFNSYGGVITLRAFSVGALIWLATFWILQLLLRKAKAYPIHQGHNRK